jgi:RNA polymerase sigma-70 factor (ECF subfamily)
MEAAIAGDAAAILALLSAAQPDIRRFARASCRTSSDAEDAVQEALWILYRRIGGLRGVGAFSGWLYQVVNRACQRLARRMTGDHRDLSLFEDDLRLSERPLAELRLDIARAVQSLPAHYRDVLLLRDVEELTMDEISDRLRLSRESVKARLHRARLMMRDYLAD